MTKKKSSRWVHAPDINSTSSATQFKKNQNSYFVLLVTTDFSDLRHKWLSSSIWGQKKKNSLQNTLSAAWLLLLKICEVNWNVYIPSTYKNQRSGSAVVATSHSYYPWLVCDIPMDCYQKHRVKEGEFWRTLLCCFQWIWWLGLLPLASEISGSWITYDKGR